LKHKLLLINFLLIALVAASGSVLRQKWLDAHAHEESVLKRQPPPVPPLTIAPIPAVPPAAPGPYIDVAQKLLTARDRNPNIFIEPPKPPPPPPAMPALPFQYGYMDFGSGATVLLAEKAGGPQHGYHIGDKIGPFKLLGVNNTDILFEWEGKPVKKKLSDLVDKSAATAAASAANNASTAGAAAPPPPPKPQAPAEARPGTSMGGEAKACQPGDNSPAGTVADGFKKVVTASPFGQACRWEPAK
jgi:hypothetical protein